MDIQTGSFNKMEVDFKQEDFKQEWSQIETIGVRSILTELIKEEFQSREDQTADDFFQLAYISSGDFVGLQVCTSEITIEDNVINVFLIRNNNQLIAQCFDANESYVYYEVK